MYLRIRRGFLCLGLSLSTGFYIEVGKDNLKVGGLGQSRAISLRDVRRVVVIEGGRGAKEISTDADGAKLLLNTASTMQEFEELPASVKQRRPSQGVRYEYRDTF